MPILHFKGKPFLKNYHHTVPFHRLVEDAEKSTSDTPSLDDNLIIHGDNLKALKALLPTHAGKVNCIYIDPPYNTGNEGWAYNDNVNSPMIQKWLGQVVDKDDLTRHDKWCCMMYPRLVLLRELMREDGIFFVSIDDNEAHHLRALLDEVFGAENFIEEIIWQRTFATKNDARFFSSEHEQILVYARDIAQAVIRPLPRTDKQNARYANPDKDERGPWVSTDLLRMEHRDNGVYEIIAPSGKKWKPKPGTSWRHPEDEMKELIANNEVTFGSDGSAKPRRKRFLKDVRDSAIPQTIWKFEEVGHTQDAKQQLKQILDESEDFFETPKPVGLIRRVLQLAAAENGIVLDSFAGSGTTAHAVLDMNQEDGGNLKFILVECEEYANDITAERVRRVSRGVPNARDEKLREGLGGTFSYFTLGDPIDVDAMLDGTDLPSFTDLAKYAFHTATGENIDLSKIDPETFYIGSSKTFEVFLIYEPDKEKLKELALNSGRAEEFHERFPNRRKLVFAPCCYLDDWHLSDLNISFAQLPFEIYRIAT